MSLKQDQYLNSDIQALMVPAAKFLKFTDKYNAGRPQWLRFSIIIRYRKHIFIQRSPMNIQRNYEDLEPWKALLTKLSKPDQLSTQQLVSLCDQVNHLQKWVLLCDPIPNLSPKSSDFYLSTFTPTLVKSLLTRSEGGCLNAITNVLQSCLDTYLLHGHRHQYKLYEILEPLFDSTKKFYKMNVCKIEDLVELKTEEEFLEGLKEGEEVDVVSYRDQLIGHWITGKVVGLNKLAKWVKVRFEDGYDETVAMGWKVQPKGTRCINYQWRKELRVGDQIDAFDTAKVWITSTVISVQPETMKIEIGFRTFNPANSPDPEPYVGWSSKFDTTMSIFDPRVQLKYSRAKRFCKSDSKKMHQQKIQDTNDLLFQNEYNKEKIYAVPRDEGVSSIYFELVTHFGKKNGFDKILQQIIDKECTPEQMEGLLNGLYKLSDRLCRMFVYEYIQKLKDVVWESMEEWTDAFIRKLTREMVVNIIADLNPLMLRYYSIDEKKQWISNFSLQVALKCLKTQYLQRKIQGLKMLDDYIKSLQNQKGSEDKEKFLDWVEQYEVFEEIYQPHSHIQLLKRSYDLFKYIVSSLKTSKIKGLWRLISTQDAAVKEIMFKFLNDCSKKLRPHHLDHIFNNLSLFKAADINDDFLELLSDTSTKDDWQIKAIKFLWLMLINDTRSFKPKMKEKTNDKIITLIKSLNCSTQIIQELLEDALNRPISKTITAVLLATVYSAKRISEKLIRKYIEHIIACLKILPEKKYNILHKIFELLIDLEELDQRISDEMENDIISSIQPSGTIYLLSYLAKRHSDKLVYPPAETLTPETFKMVMETFEKNLKVHSQDPQKLPFFDYLASVLDHSNPQVQALACQVTASLYISNYNEVGQVYLARFLTECLLHNSIPYYIIIRTLIQGLQTNWPNLTFANIAVPTDEIQLTIMNDILVCHDSSRSYAFKMNLNNPVRHIFSYLSTKTGLSRLELKITHNHHQIAETDSIKTLYEVGLKNSSILHCSRRAPNKKALVNPITKTLSEAAKTIFTDAFKEYSTENKMGKEQFKTFYEKFSYLNNSMEQTKLNRLFNNKEFLVLQDFLKHYEKEAQDSDFMIRSFLERMGYMSNLVKKNITHQSDVDKAPTSLLLQNSQTYPLLFRNALTADSIEKQKQIITILYRLPIYTYFFTGRSVPDLMQQLARENNPYVIWYCFTVIRYLMRKDCNPVYINFSNETMAIWASEMKKNGIDLIIISLRKIYRYFEERKKENYILPLAMEDLLTLLHQLVMEKGKEKWDSLGTMIPGAEELKSPYFVPNKDPPQQKLGLDLKWLLPKVQFNNRINELIYQILIVEIVLDNANCWGLLDLSWDVYKFKRLQMWCASLSLWKGKIPDEKAQQLIDKKKYELAAFILQNYSGKMEIDFVSLTNKLVKELLSHESSEKRNSLLVDQRLVGLLTIIDTIFTKESALAQSYDSLAEELMYGFLFPKGDLLLPQSYFAEEQHKQAVKCFSNESRSKAFSIVACITKNNPKEFEKIMHNFMKKITGSIPIPKKMDKRLAPVRSQLGYVGLRNLGATCYMNAITQQIFCCEPLRRGIMSGTGDDAFLHELQRLFSYLEFSERMDFEPTDFFKHVRIGGEPAPTNVQQDAHQFLNFFFDKLESVFKNTPFLKVLRNICYGTTVSQITCQGCGNVKVNPDSFYDLSLQVKEKATLYESLEKLIEGEIITGFHCEKCDKKQNVHKRVLIDQLPNYLTINLQRIIFDLDILQNKKIHTKLQFPEILNLKPFTRQHHKQTLTRKQSVMQDQDAKKHDHQQESSAQHQYRLKGVVVHLGTAQGGHYYSLIKIDSKWIVFDDSRISPFEDTIENECFGGLSQEDWAKDVDYSKNAYVLMYERVHKSKMVLENISEAELKSLQPILKNAYTREFEDDPVEIDESQLKEVVIEKYWKQVWQDNNLLMQENMLLSETLSNFICTIFGQLAKPYLPEGIVYYQGELEPQIAQLYDIAFNYLIYYTFDIGGKVEIDAKPIYQINKLLRVVPKKVGIILQNFFKLNFLLGGTKQYRVYIKTLYMESIIVEVYLAQNEMTKQARTVLDGFLAEMNFQVAKNWNKAYEYFDLIKDLMCQSQPVLMYLIEKDIISLLIDFIMDKDSPIQLSEKKYQISNSIQLYSFLPICNSIYLALRRQKNLLDEEVWPQPNLTTVCLTKNAKICLDSEEVLKRMLRDRGSIQWISWVMYYLCVNNLQYSQKIARLILVSIGSFYSTEDFLSFVGIIQCFLMIPDNFSNERFENLLGFPKLNMNSAGSFCLTTSLKNHVFSYPSTLINDGKPLKSLLDLLCKDKSQYKPYTIMGINLIVNICLTVQRVFQYMIRLPSPNYLYAHYFEWMEEYLLQFITEGYKYHKVDFNATDFGQKTYESYTQLMDKIKQKVTAFEENIKKTNMVFAEKRGIKLPVDMLPDPTICKGLTKQYIYGCTYKIVQVSSTQIQPGLSLAIYDHFVYKANSTPCKDNNKVFPRFLTDSKGKIDVYELQRYPLLTKLIYTIKKSYNGSVRYELLEDEDVTLIDFDPIFSNTKTQKKPKRKIEQQLPMQCQTGPIPPPDESATIRTFHLVNKTNNRYTLKLLPQKSFISYLPKQVFAGVDPGETRLVLTSLEQHLLNTQILTRIEVIVKKQMVVEAPIIPAAEDYGIDLEDRVECPKCTFYNPLTAYRCEACHHDL